MKVNLLENTEIVRVSDAVAAGTTTVTPTAGVDTDDCEGVLFLVSMGTIVAGAATSVKIQQSADDSSYADLEGSSATVEDDDDNQIVAIDVNRPTDRYVLPIVLRATQDSTVDGIVAIKYGMRKVPVTQGATVLTGPILAGPDEGTA